MPFFLAYMRITIALSLKPTQQEASKQPGHMSLQGWLL